jgi:hypothetical protein
MSVVLKLRSEGSQCEEELKGKKFSDDNQTGTSNCKTRLQ